MKKYLKEYCVGCGLCGSMNKGCLESDDKGYYYPKDGDGKWLNSVCPAGGSQQKLMDKNLIWGRSEASYYGWSKDTQLRTIASSGGILTEVSAYLLSKGKVDYVIHTSVDPEDATKTITVLSSSREELISRSGSRYAISHPLSTIGQLDKSKKYAFIGKPCDITSLKNFMQMHIEYKEIIPYTLSFFCAGLPSNDAQLKLLSELGCEKSECVSLRYRGDGWPGYATAINSSGEKFAMDYDSSWGKILGRDIMKMCRFCLDGIGEVADISCGDAWYLTKDKKPDFSEREGRNIIFARTKLGLEILNDMKKENLIELIETNAEDLKYMQKYQYERRATMQAKLTALRILGKSVPQYSNDIMKNYAKGIDKQTKKYIFKGTLKRALKGKI